MNIRAFRVGGFLLLLCVGLPHPSSLICHPPPLILHPSSFIVHPSSLILHPSSLFSPSAAFADEAADYMLHCRGCHGPDGAGIAEAAPAFRGTVGRFLQVPGGREYLVRVPGAAQSELSDARLAALLTWLVREFSPAELPADFVPYDAAEVAQARRLPLTDVIATRQALVAAFAAARQRR